MTRSAGKRRTLRERMDASIKRVIGQREIWEYERQIWRAGYRAAKRKQGK